MIETIRQGLKAEGLEVSISKLCRCSSCRGARDVPPKLSSTMV